jgi:hypothetical protein
MPDMKVGYLHYRKAFIGILDLKMKKQRTEKKLIFVRPGAYLDGDFHRRRVNIQHWKTLIY